MPVQWPGNTATKLARAANGGGFESAITEGLNLVLPDANLYRQTFEDKTPDIHDLNTINLTYIGMYNGLVTDLDGGTTGGRVYRPADGIIEPPLEVPDKNWIAHEGSVSMLVSAAEQTSTSTPEQNVGFDPIAARDTWVRYWVRIPTNYYPPTNHINGQHKFFVMFQDDYSGGGTGTTNMFYLYRSSTADTITSGITAMEGPAVVSTGHIDKKDMFNYVERRGQWLQLIMRHRLNSAPGAGDGAIHVWYRWDGETSLTLQHGLNNLNLERATTAGLEGFRRARFSSAREGDVADRMDFLFDEIEFADTPLVPAGTEGL